MSIPRLTPSYLPKETGLQGGYGNRPPRESLEGTELPSVVSHMPLPCWKEMHLPDDRPRPCCVDSGGSTISSHVVGTTIFPALLST